MKHKKIIIYVSLVIIFCVLGITVGFFREQIKELLANETTKAVDEVLVFLKNNPGEFDQAEGQSFLSMFVKEYNEAFFYSKYSGDLIENKQDALVSEYSREDINKIKISKSIFLISWKLHRTRNHDGTYTITVNGETGIIKGRDGKSGELIYTSGSDAKDVKFIVEKQQNKWKIKDSYNYFLFDALQDSANFAKSDLEKHKLLNQIVKEIEVKIQELTLTGDYGHYFTINLKGFIKNNSLVPLYYALIRINFYGINEDSKNGYDFIKVIDDNEVIRPTQRKDFSIEDANIYTFDDVLFPGDRDLRYTYTYRIVLK